jgi:hypothetical protein
MAVDDEMTNSNLYILRGKRAVKCDDATAWAKWFENSSNRIVTKEDINDVTVSTVFLGIDHAFRESSPPILFETMVFGGPLNEEQNRCSTWDEAEAMHAAMVKRVRNANLDRKPR